VEYHCENCHTLFHLSAVHAGLDFRCFNCHQPLTVPSTHTPESGGSLYLVCAACQHGFAVETGGLSGEVTCPACGQAADLGQNEETVLIDTAPPAAEEPAATGVADEKLIGEATGRMLGGYRLDGVIGETSLGQIYQGEQVALRRQVAVYLLRPQLAGVASCRETFLEQARRAAGLVHPNIARVYDVGEDADAPYMVSEFVQGQPLAQRIRAERPLDLASLGRVGAAAARALHAAHRQGMTHAGVEPANVIMTPRHDARMLHFGITLALFRAGAGYLPSGGAAAELYYAPEILAGEEPTPRSDLFGLGATLWAALASHPPYRRQQLLAAAEGRYAEAPDLREVLPEAPAHLVRLLGELIALPARERPGDASEVAVQLESLVHLEDAQAPGGAESTSRLALAQRRRYRRFRAEMDVRLQKAELDSEIERDYLARLTDLSENGAFVSNTDPLPVGTFVRLNFALEGSGGRVNVLGLVRWRDERPGHSGMGVQFLEVSTEDRGNLTRFVDNRAALEMVQGLMRTALHKTILRFLVRHWGEEVTLQKMMQGTGASRALFERALADFRKAGLVTPTAEDLFRCTRPQSETLTATIEELLRASRL
jgi:serine/threonine protein kinase/DNA-directed RNA polymerase subunit RPC12/RpoP